MTGHRPESCVIDSFQLKRGMEINVRFDTLRVKHHKRVVENEKIYPSKSFQNCFRVVWKTRRTKNRLCYATLDVKHLVVPGPAGITELEQFVGSSLTKCLTDF
jgi:hypothetical protein